MPITSHIPLALCPLCNGQAQRVKHSAGMPGTMGHDTWHAVACKTCGITMGASDRRFRDPDDAAKAWNARKPSPVLETMTRFCPGCGSVGKVPAKYRDCCPDGSHARVIPEPLANRCHDLFKGALEAARAGQATVTEYTAIQWLLNVAQRVHLALDDSEEMEGDQGRQHAIDGQHFDDVSTALERLEELPDDKPGVTMGPAQKAEWALRRLLADHE